ncbi:receptor-like_protein [Hexamita inflata]|uniref:Receptor-like protein n=1 Tax=Hexamita inflata TaxID=28002 RepID=A0AA86PJR3_9EUKA|nr:receptor-like protein [Hexamita inflata]
MDQNNNNQNQEYDEQMYRKYERKIQDGKMEIGGYLKTEFCNRPRGDPEVTNLRYLEKLNIQMLKVFINNDMCIKIQSKTIKKLTLEQTVMDQQYLKFNDSEGQIVSNPKKLNMQVDDLELENLEVFDLHRNSLEDDQLYNLAKFKKLHSLDVSDNKVDLTHIHMVLSLTKLSMRYCSLKNIDLISSLVNLEELDISSNKDLELCPLFKLKNLSKLTMNNCRLKTIDQIVQLTNLEVLNISDNYLLQIIDSPRLLVYLKELDISSNKQIDTTSLQGLKSLNKLSMRYCGLKNIGQITQLTNLEVLNISDNYQLQTIDSIRLLVNLKELDISQNKQIDITPLKNLVGLIILNLRSCALTQLSALKPLINLQTLDLSYNPNIIITELQYLKKLTHLNLEFCNLVSIYVVRPLVNIEELNISSNTIVYLDADFNQMTKLETLTLERNRISDVCRFQSTYVCKCTASQIQFYETNQILQGSYIQIIVSTYIQFFKIYQLAY